MSGRDYRDDVIEALADSEAALWCQVQALAERAVNAETDRDAYRLVAVQWSHYAHREHGEHQRLLARYERLRDEYRSLRESVLAEARAA